MIKYLVNFAQGSICIVEIERETDKTVIVRFPNLSFKGKQMKKTTNSLYCDSFSQAQFKLVKFKKEVAKKACQATKTWRVNQWKEAKKLKEFDCNIYPPSSTGNVFITLERLIQGQREEIELLKRKNLDLANRSNTTWQNLAERGLY